ncbi:uncharacterized protein FIBRA_04092 [Fibroporia radiculosa]|uniref:Uncharacterized protein n=1 Tax=Fibroporia radiculosa TaxID=599839 RepID=J4I9Z4_9APHY|nr:uncharacterized protein FIBRA_04092 [Fibroporia radiculosa]CCM02016.1 predicted protein [Fibroporia radiculosa]
MSNSDLVAYHDAIKKVNSGANVNQDAWMNMWCNTNWGSLLQPAPLSIALLGSILILASGTKDFSLIVDKPQGVPDFKWQYAQHPDSFKACLMQMVGAGYTAFETAHKDMQTIQALSGQMPDVIRNLVQLLISGEPDEVQALFPNGLADLKGLANGCKEAAEECEGGFKDMANLAQEMVLACTYKAGTSEQILAQNEINLKVLAIDKESTEKMLKNTKENLDIAKNSFLDAQDQFKDAIKSMPTGWELLAMGVVDSLTSCATHAANAFVNQATMRSQLVNTTVQAFANKISPDGNVTPPAGAASSPAEQQEGKQGQPSSVPNTDAMTDPANGQVDFVLQYASAVKTLLIAKDGKPDWAQIVTTDPNAVTGASYVRAELQRTKTKLKPGKAMSDSLSTSVDSLTGVVDKLIKSGNAGENDDKLAVSLGTTVDEQITNLQTLSQKARLVTQTAPANPPGLAPPPAPQSSSNDSAKLAVENGKFKVDQTKEVLESARKSYNNLNKQMTEQQKEMAKTMHEITSLNLLDAKLSEMIPILKKAVGSFNTLRAQISQLVQFFESITSLIDDVMAPSVARLVTTMQSAEDMILGGTSLKNFTRNLVYNQTMTPLKVAMLTTKISTVYVEISTDYILPAQRSVGNMLQFAENSDPSSLGPKLQKAQQELQKKADTASKQILDKVARDQADFSNSIMKRVNGIEDALKAIQPFQAPPSKALTDVTTTHVEDVSEQKKQEDAANPMNGTPEDLGLM